MDNTARPAYVGYEYKELTVKSEHVSMYIDCYESFGWERDANFAIRQRGKHTTLHLKRDRKLVNKAELTRLQRNFEACGEEIAALEKAKTSRAWFITLIIALIGTAFMACSVFAVTHEPPLILLCILFAVPAFAGWIAPYFVFNAILARDTRRVQPLIEAKHEEIYEICEKGHSLL